MCVGMQGNTCITGNNICVCYLRVYVGVFSSGVCIIIELMEGEGRDGNRLLPVMWCFPAFQDTFTVTEVR